MYANIPSRKRGAHFAVMAPLVTFFTFITLTAATVVSMAEHPTGPADSTPGGCADRVTAYLHQTVTRRAEVTARELRARAELNEARSLLEEENSGQRERSNDTRQRIKTAWTELESALKAVQKFDEAVLKAHGGLPRECVQEVNAGRSVRAHPVSWKESLAYIPEITMLHLRLYAETFRGVVQFTLLEYDDAVQYYNKVSRHYAQMSHNVNSEIQLRQKNRGLDEESGGLREAAEFALLYAKSILCAALPWLLLSSGFFFLALFAPFLLSAVVLPHFVWNVWVKLFLLHYVYGLTAEGFLLSLRRYVGLLLQKDWAGLRRDCATAVIDLAAVGEREKTFFNGIVAVAFVLVTVAMLFAFMYTWVMILCGLIGPAFDVLQGDAVVSQMKKDVAVRQENCPTAAAKSRHDRANDSLKMGVVRPSAKMSSSSSRGGSDNTAERHKKKKK